MPLLKETMTKEQRLLFTIKFQPTDRVPVIPLMGQWVARYMKLPKGLRFRVPQEVLQSFKDMYTMLGEYDAQYVAGFSWPRSSARISGSMGEMISAGKKGIPDNFSVQYAEKENIYFEDYQKIINLGWNKFCEEYFPKVTGTSLGQLDAAQKSELAVYKEDTKTWNKMGVPVMTGALVISAEMTLSLGRTLPQFTMDLHRHPDVVQAALEVMVPDFIHNAIDDVKASGLPWVNISLERGSGAYYNLKTYERFFFPQLKKMVDAFAREGFITVMHMDTNWIKNLPYLLELPRQKCICELDGTTDIFKAKEILKDHTCLMGDVPAAILSFGHPEEVTAYSEKLIDVIGKNGGFILSTGCECPVDAKFENMKALCDTAKTRSATYSL